MPRWRATTFGCPRSGDGILGSLSSGSEVRWRWSAYILLLWPRAGVHLGRQAVAGPGGSTLNQHPRGSADKFDRRVSGETRHRGHPLLADRCQSGGHMRRSATAASANWRQNRDPRRASVAVVNSVRVCLLHLALLSRRCLCVASETKFEVGRVNAADRCLPVMCSRMAAYLVASMSGRFSMTSRLSPSIVQQHGRRRKPYNDGLC